ncbi:PD40 domain-containing protein [Cryptosporangium arvum]|uniref:Periplasmic component of the Tol biopolymer transport system n=1 Tax=Cryptosporangium arvum DSM 44712 TaxID=927661 RepID=A0A010YWD2_9ACTN|nr:PD40 domain-containing protein [Cryptosporangium arvum]EXG79458.1 periplasmic component of the Tol biopolymer transport system [Cryptosporangium arvum DSM 44712]
MRRTIITGVVGAALALTVTSPALAAAQPATGSTWTAKTDWSLLVDNGRDMDRVVDGTTKTLLAGEAFQRKYGAYSADGRRIVYSDQGKTGFGAQIWTMNADGSHRRQLTSLTTEAFGPELSPNGTAIAFQTQGAIWVMKADGTAARKVSRDGYYYGTGISWAPDSAQFAVTRGLIDERSGEPYDIEVVTLRADGSRETALTRTGGDKNSPAWSPDGTTIVFSQSLAGENYDLWSMKADGTRVKQLTRTKDVGEQDTVWAPTGTAIAYAAWAQQTETAPRVMKAKADGTAAKSLGVVGYPTSWR